jgi:hypothetical protein
LLLAGVGVGVSALMVYGVNQPWLDDGASGSWTGTQLSTMQASGAKS